MTAFRMPISDSLPPTADFWAEYVSDGDPGDHPLAGVSLHLGYGMAAGVVFALASPVLEGRTAVERERRGVLLGVAYGLLLSAFGEWVLLERLLRMDLTADERFVFHVSHVVYGLTLGTWAGSKVE